MSALIDKPGAEFRLTGVAVTTSLNVGTARSQCPSNAAASALSRHNTSSDRTRFFVIRTSRTRARGLPLLWPSFYAVTYSHCLSAASTLTSRKPPLRILAATPTPHERIKSRNNKQHAAHPSSTSCDLQFRVGIVCR